VNRGADRLQRLVARVCPELPEALWVPRWLLLIGLLFHGLADYAHLVGQRGEGVPVPPRELFVSNLVDSIVALLEAPCSGQTSAWLA
jgi:hypothetical protein